MITLPSVGLTDRHDRTAVDLRVSLTERCNLRCTYCMPAAGLPVAPDDAIMTADEIVRLVTLSVRSLGVRRVRFTGGEPLLRHDLIDIVRRCSGLAELAITTNAIGLASRAKELRAAGLDRVNISLDSVDAETFAAVTRRPFLTRAVEGIDAAIEAGLVVKVNAVLLRGVNDASAPDLLRWCLARGIELRFIEQMPLDPDHVWTRDGMITAAETRALLGGDFSLEPVVAPRDGAPAERFLVHSRSGELLGSIGIIASITESFCADCTRTRLTADGHVRTCLFSDDETDLLGALRGGASDARLADMWRQAMRGKPRAHGSDDDGLIPTRRGMSAIGG